MWSIQKLVIKYFEGVTYCKSNCNGVIPELKKADSVAALDAK